MIGNRLERYIASSILNSILIIIFIIICLASLFALVDQVNDFKNNYGILQALQYVALTAPRRLYDNLPMAALVGSLIGLGTLASRSELTIMRAAGMSTGRIVYAVMKPVFIIMIASVLIGEYIIPKTETKAIANKELAISYNIDQQVIEQTLLKGTWHRQGHEYIRINSVQPNGLLFGVTRYYIDNQQIKYASYAKQAIFEDNEWQLKDSVTTCFNDDHTKNIQHTSETWLTPTPSCDIASIQEKVTPIDITPELLTTINSNPSNLSIAGLWKYIHYLEDQELNNDNYWLKFWEKLLQPIKTLALVLLAISFIFGPLRSVTMGQRIFIGVTIGFVFKIVHDLLGPASLVFNFPPLLAAITPSIVCIIIGVYLLKRKR
ncbi:LPS export ABC transporter permease LptG [Entomomonas asaccharolytica]|uniref:LPS export ABC transporter permease LptG n=1 Tax=Entomomonas asaccharolytica TaxID=2785331 RepID=A0A974RZ33_9GAMM|nr:LPS export ABC transporter permease LptG [Entomomonas asaccharolytica]QQP86629.1 LPS export ABC transporter permease LptG [Entomomonas asaccharolytica]